jgi:hypothetical protein
MGGRGGDKGVADKGKKWPGRPDNEAIPPRHPVALAPHGGKPVRIYDPTNRSKFGEGFDYEPPKPNTPVQ